MDIFTAQKEYTYSETLKASLRTIPTWKEDLVHPACYISHYKAAVTAGTPAYIVRHALGELRAEAVILNEAVKKANGIGAVDWGKVEEEVEETLGNGHRDIHSFFESSKDTTVFSSGNRIPASLNSLLIRALEDLAAKSRPTFTPLQTGKVHTVIDPDRYSFIHDTTYTPASASISATTSTSEPYQWLPTTVYISSTGKARITSPINSLPRSEHEQLYALLEHFITLCLPSWQQTLPNISLTNTSLQLVFSAQSIILPPLQTYSTPYHHAGLALEHIAMTSSYTYSSSSLITNHGTSFRYRTTNGEETRPCPATIELGTLPTPAGTLLTSPNTLQSRTTGLKNTSPESFAQHKTLTIHVIDPSSSLPGTENIPPQETYEQTKISLYTLLQSVANKALGPHNHFCPEVAGEIVQWAKWGLTEEEAMAHRWRAVALRNKMIANVNTVWDGESDEEGEQ